MLTEDGKSKYVCPGCGGDNIGESGMGKRYVHCFTPCFVDILKKDCPTAPVVSVEEAKILSREPY